MSVHSPIIPTMSERMHIRLTQGANSGEGGYYRFNTETGELVLQDGTRTSYSVAGKFNENMGTSSHTATPHFSKPNSTL